MPLLYREESGRALLTKKWEQFDALAEIEFAFVSAMDRKQNNRNQRFSVSRTDPKNREHIDLILTFPIIQ